MSEVIPVTRWLATTASVGPTRVSTTGPETFQELLPPRQASPGVNTCGLYMPLRTSCPHDCVLPPGPFPFPTAVIGALGSSFSPENAQMELALAGAPVVPPLPVTSPALAIPTPEPTRATAHTAAVIKDFRNIVPSPI